MLRMQLLNELADFHINWCERCATRVRLLLKRSVNNTGIYSVRTSDVGATRQLLLYQDH
jgi:hypothetical protein